MRARFLVSTLGFLVAGCRDEAVTVVVADGGTRDAGDAGHGGHVVIEEPAPIVDAGPREPVDAGRSGCAVFEDQTAADPTIIWIRSVGTKCLRIKKGQSVTWDPAEGFDVHPLLGFGGTTPTPIADQQNGDAPYKVTFPEVGSFGFVCAYHANMRGVIEVVE